MAQPIDGQQTRVFNPNDHLIQLKSKEGSKDYLPVQWRLVWFREQCPLGTIDTEEVTVDLDREVEEEVYAWNNEKRRSEKVIKHAKGYARFRAIATDGKGGRATGTKSENGASFPDYIEKAETGAIGRALAALGFGTQFAPDLEEAHRIVDSPVERQPQATNGSNSAASSVLGSEENASATEQQLSSITKLCDYLGKPTTTPATFVEARKEIQRLSAEYREAKEARAQKTGKAS